jgi:hypothetical protein
LERKNIIEIKKILITGVINGDFCISKKSNPKNRKAMYRYKKFLLLLSLLLKKEKINITRLHNTRTIPSPVKTIFRFITIEGKSGIKSEVLK